MYQGRRVVRKGGKSEVKSVSREAEGTRITYDQEKRTLLRWQGLFYIFFSGIPFDSHAPTLIHLFNDLDNRS
jgi:hypothetical protein